jgi:DNA processing protein
MSERYLRSADAGYPRLLAEIPDPPPLFWRGVPWVEKPAVAIVGSRDATPYGRTIATELAEELAHLGLVIVSGLARGIDAAAHRGCLAAGGQTLAVLGCGLNVHYPPEHTDLAEEIARTGALISELPPSAPPRAAHFPARNRIISGLSLGVIVVEAAERSGALITARLAGEQGREVFAVPGSLRSSQSAGAHRLIQDGAKLVRDVSDILVELRLPLPAGPALTRAGAGARAPFGDDRDAQVLRAVRDNPMHVDTLARACAIPHADLLHRLTLLEIGGYIMRLDDQRITSAP